MECWNVGKMDPENNRMICLDKRHQDVFKGFQRYLSNHQFSVFSEATPLISITHFRLYNVIDPIVRIPLV
jgi:hypothetical protein